MIDKPDTVLGNGGESGDSRPLVETDDDYFAEL
jgi:hypothetical protein